MIKARLLNEKGVIIGDVDIPEGPYPQTLRVGPTTYIMETGARLTAKPSYRATTTHTVAGKIEMRATAGIPVKGVGDDDDKGD